MFTRIDGVHLWIMGGAFTRIKELCNYPGLINKEKLIITGPQCYQHEYIAWLG
jgi:hypothetical protein